MKSNSFKEKDASRYHRIFNSIQDLNLFGTRKLTRLLASILLPLPQGEVISQTIYGFKLQLNPRRDTGIDRYIYHFGTYEKGTLEVMKQVLKPGDLFVDVGANIGLMTLYASKLVGPSGRVLAYEANADTFRILIGNIERNQVENVQTFLIALGDAPGFADLDPGSEHNRGSASIIPSAQGKIEIKRLDSFEELKQAKKPTMIKMDVEGFEMKVLRGCGNILKGPDAPSLIVESGVNEDKHGESAGSLFHFLKEVNDYRLFKLSKGKDRIGPLKEILVPGQMPEDENVFCFLPNHIPGLGR